MLNIMIAHILRTFHSVLAYYDHSTTMFYRCLLYMWQHVPSSYPINSVYYCKVVCTYVCKYQIT